VTTPLPPPPPLAGESPSFCRQGETLVEHWDRAPEVERAALLSAREREVRDRLPGLGLDFDFTFDMPDFPDQDPAIPTDMTEVRNRLLALDIDPAHYELTSNMRFRRRDDAPPRPRPRRRLKGKVLPP
jgi:hypothetical protein